MANDARIIRIEEKIDQLFELVGLIARHEILISENKKDISSLEVRVLDHHDKIAGSKASERVFWMVLTSIIPLYFAAQSVAVQGVASSVIKSLG